MGTQLPDSAGAGELGRPLGLNACVDITGRRHLFGLTIDGRLLWLTDESGRWVSQDIGAGAVRSGVPAITYRADKGRLDVFASSTDGQTMYRTRTATNRWSGWQSIGSGQSTSGFDAVLDDTNAHHIFGVAGNGGPWQWYGWLGGSMSYQDVGNNGALVAAAAVTFREGWLDLFGVGSDGGVWWQRSQLGTSSWSGWRPIGGSSLIALNAKRSPDGSFTLVGTTSSGQLTRLQSADGTQWTSSNVSFGRTAVGRAAVLATRAGTEIMVVGTDNQVWTQTVNGSSSTGWQPIGGYFGAANTRPSTSTVAPTSIAVPSAAGTGPVSFKSLADARANLNLPADAQFYMWPTNKPSLMLEEVFMGMADNQILVLPERTEPYYIDSSDGFRAAGINWIRNGPGGPTIPIINQYKGRPARTWFAMARARKGILGLGPGAVIQPSPSSFSRSPQAYPGLVADTGWEMRGCNDKLIETETTNAYFGNFTMRSRDFGGMAYQGITANRGVTYENLNLDAAFRSFSTEPNGEAGALNVNGTYLIRNVRIKATDSSGMKVGTTAIMINSSPSGRMENVAILDSSGPAWWNCSGTHEAVNLSVGAGAPNFEAARSGFVMNWTGGGIVATQGVHVSLRSPFGSQKITWKGLKLGGNVPTSALHVQQYGAGTGEARTQRQVDLACRDAAGNAYPIVFRAG